MSVHCVCICICIGCVDGCFQVRSCVQESLGGVVVGVVVAVIDQFQSW